MWCLGCSRRGGSPLCPSCLADMPPAPARWVSGVLVRPGFVHDGIARRLVHRLKYRADPLPGIGRVLVPLLPRGATALVPVPRVMARRWRYGVDPAAELARSVAAHTGLEVIPALSPPLWLHRRAGARDAPRGTPRFSLARPVPEGAVLVDDVLTTGATLVAAATVSGIVSAVTLTAAGGRQLKAES